MSGNAGSDVGDVNVRVAHDRARIIGDSSQDGAVGASLAIQQTRRHNDEQHTSQNCGLSWSHSSCVSVSWTPSGQPGPGRENFANLPYLDWANFSDRAIIVVKKIVNLFLY